MVKTKLRIILTVIFAVLCCVFVFKISHQGSKLSYDEYGFGGSHGLQLRKLNQPFSWHGTEDFDEERVGPVGPNKTFTTCRNSVQGKVLIADDRGYVCLRADVLSVGCCNVNLTATVRYNCGECQETTGCCKLYEHCISCCMDPRKNKFKFSTAREHLHQSDKQILLPERSAQGG